MAKTTKMLIIILLLCVITLTLFRSLHQQLNPAPNKNLPAITIDFQQQKYTLEIARSENERAAGLSNRPTLCPNCGMIFIFNREMTLPFWMKDTLIPLDMIWVNHAGKVISIQTALPEPRGFPKSIKNLPKFRSGSIRH